MRLAWHNIAHDRGRFLVTIFGITCATLLMIVQGSILIGFLGAASKIIDSADADLWIAGRGASCFEFPVLLRRDVEQLAHGVPGVVETSRIVTRIVPLRKADGGQPFVTLVGADPGVGSRFPMPRVAGAGSAVQPRALLIDETSSYLLDTSQQMPQAVELNDQRANVIRRTSGFSSFLGTPYVFTTFVDGARYAGLRSAEVMFILVRVQAGASVLGVQRDLRERLPNADVWTKAEFASRAQVYWMSQTGAGGAILAAALLGFIIGLAIVSQATYATTMEHIEEFMTLKAIGATHAFVVRVIVSQALCCGVLGYILGFIISQPAIRYARYAIPWLATPPSLPLLILPVALIICVLASILSVRAALAVEPAKVFRA